MKTILKPPKPGTWLSLMLLCSCAIARAELPAEVVMNKEAGRGELLVVPVRLEGGEELPFIVDTGSGMSLLDESLAPKLGERVGTFTMQSWGTKNEHAVYAAPRLYLGGAPLMTGSNIGTFNCKQWSSDPSRPVMGMLSIDCLRNYCIQLDFQAGKMRFLDPAHVDGAKLGKAFPITFYVGRPWVYHDGLVEGKGKCTLIDTGYDTDGAIKELVFRRSYFPERVWEGKRYTNLVIGSGGHTLGLRFLARHLVTLDFPNRTMYLRRQSSGPLPGDTVPFMSATRVETLEPLIRGVLDGEPGVAHTELLRLKKSSASELEKTVARKLAATLMDEPKPAPADVPLKITELSLGDARAQVAEVGWLEPAANRIPANNQIESPLLDSGKIYATGLYAHSPSRYVFDLGGRWKTLQGEAGVHTAHQPYACGVVFVIKTDGKEAFRSSIIRGAAKASYKVDVRDVKSLELVVEQAQSQNYNNWSLWLDPTLKRR